MYMSYKGRYKPENPKKYKGDSGNIVYRSLWERKFMRYCDLNENVNQWQSEEFSFLIVPIDGKMHRYFPDFFVKYKDANSEQRCVVIEVKPAKEVKMLKESKRRTKAWAYSVQTWVVNQAKWDAAKSIVQIVTMNSES